MQEHNRLIDVYWSDNTTENYAVEIEILAVNTNDILKNVIQIIEKSKSSLLGVEANVNKQKLAVIKVKIIVKDYEFFKICRKYIRNKQKKRIIRDYKINKIYKK